MKKAEQNNPTSRIAILGWGSLVWDPRGLPLSTPWRVGGPKLPIEFSRVSKNGRLTLVIDPDNGTSIQARFARSVRMSLDEAIGDLARREETKREYIDFANLSSGVRRASVPSEGRAELFREALKSIIAREAGRRLIALGGTAPELKDIPRRKVDQGR